MNISNLMQDKYASHHCYEGGMTISALFAAQVQHRANSTAIVQDSVALTYEQLGHLVASIAEDLTAAGVNRGDRVGLLAGRSIMTIAAQLAVVSLGAAFVPFDPKAAQVNGKIASAAGITALACPPDLVTAAGAVAPAGCAIVLLRQQGLRKKAFSPDPAIQSEDLAYVIFTSGSTGQPKGVMVAHRGVCRLVRGQTYADLGPEQVVLNLAAVSFDVCISEIYCALLNGGTLVIVPDAVPSLDRISQIIKDNNVTVAYITAGLFHVIAEQNPQILAPLRMAIPCGDVLSRPHVQLVRDMLPDLSLINGYGPTENTVFTCFYTIDETWDGGPVPIGRGLAYDEIQVLDDSLNPVADDIVGQLAVGGAGIALGYLGRPDLTAAVFVTLPGHNKKFYLTGDLVSRGTDGVIRFRGRMDRQIKINGQRVELDSVEHALRGDEAVQDAVALAQPRNDGSQQIVAFIVPALKGTSDDEVSQAVLGRMRATMPAASVPTRIGVRDKFPLSASGKVDRKRLADELASARLTLQPGLLPATLRGKIRQTWAEVLDCDIPDTNATFFDLGGTSLQLIAVHTALQARLGQTFDIAKLFQAPRLRDLEKLLGQDSGPDLVAQRRAQMAERRGRS